MSIVSTALKNYHTSPPFEFVILFLLILFLEENFVMKPYPTPQIPHGESRDQQNSFGQRFTLQLNTPTSK